MKLPIKDNLMFIFLLVATYLTSFYSFLLFHTLAELFSIIIACVTFVVILNTRQFALNAYLLLVGVASLFVAGIDLVHTLAYKGMGVFSGYNANLPTQLWIAARAMESITLVAAPLLMRRSLKLKTVFGIYLLLTAALLYAVFSGHFPDCFLEGKGLTPFKIAGEYVICAMLLLALYLLHRERAAFAPAILNLLMGSLVATIIAELAFTFYVSVYGLSNLVGHLFKIIAFYLIYRAIIVTGLRDPLELLFRELKNNEVRYRRERNRAQQYLDIAGALIAVIDTAGRVVLINQQGREIIGYAEREIVGQDWFEILTPAEERSERRAMLHRILVKEERPEGQIERTILTRDGNRRLVAFQYALVRDEAGDVAGLLVSGRDVTAQKAAEETIQRLAFYDALTELPNRRLLMDRMEIALSRAARHKEKFAVMLMDLDKFKNVNDTLGHAVGDMMLKAVSARLTSAVRRMDTVARLGGDEFVILLPELENIQDCRIIAAKLLSLFNDAFYLGEKSLLISTSIGAAVYPDDGEDIETILKYADIAMYRAKEQGRNRMVMYMDGNSSLAAGAGEAPPKK